MRQVAALVVGLVFLAWFMTAPESLTATALTFGETVWHSAEAVARALDRRT